MLYLMKWKYFRNLKLFWGWGIISKDDGYWLTHEDVCVADVLDNEDTDNV